jgi:hypothetical protein
LPDLHAIPLGSFVMPDCTDCDALPGTGRDLSGTLCPPCKALVLALAAEHDANAVCVVYECDRTTTERSVDLSRKPR